MERRSIVFAGTVQGVGFRATARHVASGFRVSGWVRNQPDSTVVLEVQGAPDEVERFLGALRARLGGLIRSENALPVPIVEGETSFEIRR